MEFSSMSEFGRLIEEQIPHLLRYARALTRDRMQADELTQSCLARALDKEDLWQPGSYIRAWLLTILHNLHVNDLRRSAREDSGADIATASLPGGPSRSEARLELRDLNRAIGTLPDRHGTHCRKAAFPPRNQPGGSHVETTLRPGDISVLLRLKPGRSHPGQGGWFPVGPISAPLLHRGPFGR